MGKRFKAAIIGGSGYGAGEMLRRLLIHPEVEVIRVSSVDLVGKNVAAAHPNLSGLSDLVLEDIAPREAARGCDVALLALPHKVTAQKVPELLALGVKVVDMSGDFRLRSAAEYQTFYGGAHPHPELLGTFVYGLPELNRGAIKKSSRVASPGCFATATELALLPLAKAGLLRGPIHVNAITGSSGSGAAPQAGTHHPVRAVNLKTYKPLVHQHTPEIVQTLRDAGAAELELRFVPVSAPLSRGIFVTAFVEVDEVWDDKHIAGLFDERYHAEPFVRRPLDRLPEVAAVAGSNYVEVGFAVDEARAGRRTVTCFAAIDNLIKGGAGQAIQDMNLVLGLDEKLSLEDPGELAMNKPRTPSMVVGRGSARQEAPATAIVVKVGGELFRGGAIAAVAADVAELVGRGHQVFMVHGGGPQATALQQALGQEPRVVAGRRITDGDALDVVKMVVAGQLNVDLCSALVAAGVRPVGLHGASGPVIRAIKRPPRLVSGGGPDPVDFGLVGDVVGFDLDLLRMLASTGRVPVLACIGCDPAGQPLNINADIIASQLSSAIRVAHLVLVTSAPGVLRDKADPTSRIPRLTAADARAAIADGTVAGGMIPKIEESLAALAAGGIAALHIMGEPGPGDLLREIDEPGAVGTALVP